MRSSAGRRRSGRAGRSRSCTTRSPSRAGCPTRESAPARPAPAARFDWIGFAVAAPTPVRRATTPSRASEARRRAGACRVLELFIELVRSSKGTAAVRRYPCEVKMVAGAAGRVQPTTDKNPCKSRFLTRVDGAVFCYGLRLVRSPTSTWPLLGAAVLSGVLFTGSIPMVGAAQTGPGLAKQAGALRRSESSAAPAALRGRGRARPRAGRAGAARRPLERARRGGGRRARCETEIVRRSLDASQRRVAALLRAALHPGRARPDRRDPRSDLARRGHDGDRGSLARHRAERAARARGGREGPAALCAARRTSPAQRDRASTAPVPRRAPARARLAAAVAGQRETVATIRRQAALTRSGLPLCRPRRTRPSSARPASRPRGREHAQRLGRGLRAVSPHATTRDSGAPPTPVTGTHTLVVDAVAYHLPGNTASGLPVGVGVIAVDPTRDPARHARLRPGLRAGRRGGRRLGDQGQHHRSLDADDGAGTRLGPAHRHDHHLRLSP